MRALWLAVLFLPFMVAVPPPAAACWQELFAEPSVVYNGYGHRIYRPKRVHRANVYVGKPHPRKVKRHHRARLPGGGW